MSARTELSSRVIKDELVHLLQPERVATIYRHARDVYPRECCGMVLSSGIVRPCANAQDDLHGIDPTAFRRTSRNAYCFDVNDQLFLARSFESGDPVRIVYHSHPDAEPEFSQADQRGATVDGTPLYPGLSFLIVRITPTAVGPAKVYSYSRQGYVESALIDLIV